MYLSGQYLRSTSSRSDGFACSSSEYSDESESFWGFLMSSPRSYLCGNQISDAPRHRRDVVPVTASARCNQTHWLISTQVVNENKNGSCVAPSTKEDEALYASTHAADGQVYDVVKRIFEQRWRRAMREGWGS